MYDFKKSMIIGKQAEKYAEQYFIKNKWQYKDVRNNPDYWKIDIDYIVNNETYEVKRNFHNAIYGRAGWYFWIELKVGNNLGWWYKTQADYFLFFSADGDGILIRNNESFKKKIENFIEYGDHSLGGNQRYDIIKDKRKDRYIEATNMRVYIKNLLIDGVNIKKIINRKK